MAAPHISRFLLGFFRLIARAWFSLHFDAVLAGDVQPFTASAGTAPLIVYGNHSSWWDPMIAVLLADKLMPGRQHFAPMDADVLKDETLLQRIGIFPVDIHSARGAKQFLVTSVPILREGGVLWVTPQGRFADTREMPLGFRPGLAALATRMAEGCTLLPLATEYVFWNKRRPNALLHFGAPIHVRFGESRPALTARLEDALAAAMEELKAKALTRNPAVLTRLPLWSRP